MQFDEDKHLFTKRSIVLSRYRSQRVAWAGVLSESLLLCVQLGAKGKAICAERLDFRTELHQNARPTY
jgi:hypothetical protein